VLFDNGIGVGRLVGGRLFVRGLSSFEVIFEPAEKGISGDLGGVKMDGVKCELPLLKKR